MNDVRLAKEAEEELLAAARWRETRHHVLVFLDLGDRIRVLAVAHQKRQPGYWLDRLHP